MLYATYHQTELCRVLLTSDGEALTGLWLENQKHHWEDLLADAVENPELPVFTKTKDWLNRYFRGEKPLPGELELCPSGTEFRQRVWKVLCEIPYGETTTYGKIAAKIAQQMGRNRMSSQAVGGAVGHNPIGIVIPCHRVIGTNGNLTGYAGGLETKVKLLEHEGTDLSGTFIPPRGTAL